MKKTIKVLIILILTLAIAMALVSCVDPQFDDETNDEQEEIIKRTQIVKNGTFYDASNTVGSKRYVKENVPSWEIQTGTLSKASDGVMYGAIDMANKELFEREKNKFSLNNTIEYPGIDPKTPKEKDDPTKDQDTNALLLASIKTAGSIYYKNSNADDFSLKTNTYYKLQFSVLTDIDLTDVPEDIQDKKGAWVIFDGGIYQEFRAINTNNQWQTYEIYIQSSDYDASRPIKVRLWLGHGPDKIRDVKSSTIENPYLTKGTVLFDNIICQELEDFSEQDFVAIQTTDTVKKSTMLFPDMNFVQESETTISSASEYFYSFRSGAGTSSNAANYTLVDGKTGLTANKPTVNKAYTGIVDMSQMYRIDDSKSGEERFIDRYQEDFSKTTFVAPDRQSFFNDDGIFRLIDNREDLLLSDTKALMLFHSDLSGAGFTSSKQLLIRKNAFYTIKVWAYVWEIDFPEPKSADVGTQPKEPTMDEPTEESLDLLRQAKDSAYADLLWWRIDDEDEDLTFEDLSDEIYDDIRDLITAINEDEQKKTELRNKTLRALENAYSDCKENFNEEKHLLEEWEIYHDKKAEYDEKVATYNEKYRQWEDENSKPYAKFKITGAGDLDPVQTTTVGQWEELVFYINGNQLSNRKVNLEFWFGEGTNVDYGDLMIGGVLFDDISIEVRDIPESGKTYQELSPFTQKDISQENYDIGGLIASTGDIKFSKDETLTESELWEKKIVDGVALNDENFLEYSIVDDQTYPITIEGQTDYYNLLKMENSDYTAGILNFRGSRDILANKCYRLSLWAWTQDIDKTLGAKIELMTKEKDSDDKMFSASSIADFNYADAQEVVFYIKGDTLKNNSVGLKFTLGEGNMFDTDKYIKGTLFVSAITIKEIEYTEFNASSKSGDQTKSYSFTNTQPSSSDGITNANFGVIKLDDIEKDAINDEGELVGVAPTNNWTLPTSVTSNSYNKPSISHKLLKDSEIDPENGGDTLRDYIVWKHVVDADDIRADGYEIYIQNTVQLNDDEDDDKDEKDVDSLYIGYVSADANYDVAGEGSSVEYFYCFPITSKAKGNFVVRGVSNKAVGAYSNTLSNPVTSNESLTKYFEEYTVVPKNEYKIGTINYTAYGKTDENSQAIYEDIFANSSYVSPYKTMLMMTSNYAIRANVTAASKSLSSDSYYEISVWVKTLNGAKASISFKDISEILETTDEFVGYINQDTNGKWVQYRFYIATGAQSSTVQLQLSMGNPYGKGRPGEDAETTRMYDAEISKGTIFFDNVQLKTLSAEEYESKSTKKGDDNKEGEYHKGNEIFHVYEMVYSNNYAYKILSYTTDSFDSYTENTVTEEFDYDGQYKEGFHRGHTPKAYSWARATGGSALDFERLYGIYSYTEITSNDHPLLTNDTNIEPFADIINKYEDGFELADLIRITGYNTLVLSNLVENGQKYTLSSSRSLSAESYYKLSFKAKTLLAENDFAEMRFNYKNEDDTYDIIKINTGYDANEYVEYVMYIYNEDTSTESVKWAFSLGGDDQDEKIKGILVIDDVRLEKIDSQVYIDAEDAFNALDESQQELSPMHFHKYEKEDSTSGDKEPTPEKKKDSIFDRGSVWLLVSTIIISVVILLTVVVVLFRRFRRKFPKKVKGENIVKTEKIIEVTPKQPSEKDDIIDDDEFIDKVEYEQPKYVQRVLPKKKRKKRK